MRPYEQPAFRGRDDPFTLVDGNHELAHLDLQLGLAKAGTSRFLLVSGPAGVGKSRLLAEFAGRSRAAGVSVVEISVRDCSVDQPLEDFRGAIADGLRNVPAKQRAGHRAVGHRLRKLAQIAARDPALGSVLGLLLDVDAGLANADDLRTVSNLPLAQGLGRLTEVLAAQRRPLVLIVDQWDDMLRFADRARQQLAELLRQFIEQLLEPRDGRRGLLMIVGVRADRWARCHPPSNQDRLTTIAVTPLRQEIVTQLVYEPESGGAGKWFSMACAERLAADYCGTQPLLDQSDLAAVVAVAGHAHRSAAADDLLPIDSNAKYDAVVVRGVTALIAEAVGRFESIFSARSRDFLKELVLCEDYNDISSNDIATRLGEPTTQAEVLEWLDWWSGETPLLTTWTRGSDHRARWRHETYADALARELNDTDLRELAGARSNLRVVARTLDQIDGRPTAGQRTTIATLLRGIDRRLGSALESDAYEVGKRCVGMLDSRGEDAEEIASLLEEISPFLPKPTVAAVMVQALEHPSEHVRAVAAETLGWAGGDRSCELLVGALKMREQRVQLAAVRGLGHLKNATSIAALECIYIGPNTELAQAAAVALSRFGTPAAQTVLMAHLDQMPTAVTLSLATAAVAQPAGRTELLEALLCKDDSGDDVAIAIEHADSPDAFVDLVSAILNAVRCGREGLHDSPPYRLLGRSVCHESVGGLDALMQSSHEAWATWAAFGLRGGGEAGLEALTHGLASPHIGVRWEASSALWAHGSIESRMAAHAELQRLVRKDCIDALDEVYWQPMSELIADLFRDLLASGSTSRTEALHLMKEVCDNASLALKSGVESQFYDELEDGELEELFGS